MKRSPNTPCGTELNYNSLTLLCAPTIVSPLFWAVRLCAPMRRHPHAHSNAPTLEHHRESSLFTRLTSHLYTHTHAQHNTTKHNTTQHNTTQHNTTQHNTTQHNTTQHTHRSHDLVPDPTILTAALKATRRVNDFPTSVRVFEGIKDKSPDQATYDYVVQQLQPVIKELQLSTPEELGF
jgi:hypothetical protein